MKTSSVFSLLVLTLSVSLFMVSCQKEGSDTDNTDTEISTHSDDQARFSSEQDEVASEAEGLLEITAGFAARGEQLQSICGASVVVDTMSNPRTITVTYDGTNCLGNRTRTGVIIISMAQGVRWKNAGATVNLTFQNFKVTRLSDNKSITVNGTQTFTNVSGGLLVNLASVGTITHTVTSSNMSVTFDNGSQRTWQVARQRVFTYANGVVVTITGMHSANGVTGIAEWGTNRFGNTFTTAITTPFVVKQDCSFRITGGAVEHKTPAVTATATFGLDATGNPTDCPGNGSYYYKLTWTGPANNTRTIILPY
jgi:hypothetical protein